MFNNVVGKLEAKRVLDEVERGPAPGSLASHLDIGLEVRDDSLCTVECLLVHCLEIGLHV